jgi:hypothetical protein
LLTTADLDPLISIRSENVQRILAALTQFGFGGLDIPAGDLASPGKIVQLGVKPNRIDIVTSISGIAFAEAWNTRVSGNLAGIATQFIGLEALIRNKESTGRAKDLGDAEELRKRSRHP